MLILPELPANLPEEFIPELLKWSSEYAYAVLAQRDKRNEWLRIEREVDFEPIEKACKRYHTRASGENVPHHVGRMVRALYVKYHVGLSLRETEQVLRYNMGVKRFVGYGLHERVCDHSTLMRFEEWVTENEPRIYFDTVLGEVDKRYGKAEREKIQYADTFAMEADAAKKSLIGLLRQTSEKLIEAAAAGEGCDEGALWEEIDTVELLGEPKERNWFYLTEKERALRLLKTVRGALACQAVVEKRATRDVATTERLRQLKKIIADELKIERDEAGEVCNVSRLKGKKRGSYRIGSAVDPDATYREHGKGKSAFGYNASVATTDEFIWEAHADTGATPDAAALPDLLAAQKTYHDHLPEKIVYDKAAGDGKSVAAVDRVSGGKTQLVVEMRDYGKRTTLFVPHDFYYDKSEHSLTCPNGVKTTRIYRHGNGDGWSAHFLKEPDKCASCPLFRSCYKNETQKKRTVFVSDYRAHADRATAYMTDDNFTVELRQRNHVERNIAALVLHNDARRTRRRGLAAADFQLKMAACAFNLKKLLRKVEQTSVLGRSVSRGC